MPLLRGGSSSLSPVDIEGSMGWMLPADVSEAADASPVRSVRLVPAFDQYVIGATKHAAALLPGAFKDRVYRPQGWVSPVLLVAGRMNGVWRYQRKGRRLFVDIEPFVDLPGWARRGAEAEAERLAGFVGGALELTWNV